MDNIIRELTSFGLSDIEAKIYQILVTHGGSLTVWELAKGTKLPRTTIYDSVGKLTTKGLVKKVVLYKSQAYKALPVEFLETHIAAKTEEVEVLKQNLASLKAQLQLHKSPLPQTEVRYYHGKQGLQQMLYNSLSAEKELVGFSVYGRAEIVGDKYMANYIIDFNNKGLRDRTIINPTSHTLSIIKSRIDHGLNQQTLSDIRVIPESSLYISGDVMMYNAIYAVCYWQEGEIVGVEIENPEFVRHQRSMFNTLWSQAETVKNFLL